MRRVGPARRAAGAALGLAVLISASARADLVPLFVIPTASKVAAVVPADHALRIRIESRDPAKLAARLGVAPPATGATGLDVELLPNPQPPAGDAGRTWLEPTFVIDYDEPSVQALRQEFLAQHPEPPTPEAIARFVNTKVVASSDQPWQLASTVATRLRGDCTEHAVLAAALARSVGLPARVAVGLVVVAPKGQYGAFGHAWTEYRQGDRWIVADAALIGDDLQPRYLSLAWLQDEGPGYMVQFLEPLTNWARHVDVLGPGAALTDGKTP